MNTYPGSKALMGTGARHVVDSSKARLPEMRESTQDLEFEGVGLNV